MTLELVEYLSYEPEESGILWIRFNRPDRLNTPYASVSRYLDAEESYR